MKITLNTLALLLFTVFTAIAQSHSYQDVIKADAALNLLILKNNAREAKQFYADDFILTTSSGTKKLKDDILQEIASPELQLEINDTSVPTVRIVGNTAVLTGTLHQRGKYKGKTFDTYLLVTDTWVYTRNGWQILAGHASEIRNNTNTSTITAHEQP